METNETNGANGTNNGERKTGFDAYDLAVDIARAMRPIVDKIREHDRSLADEGKRATQSIGLNVARGAGGRAGTGRTRSGSLSGARGRRGRSSSRPMRGATSTPGARGTPSGSSTASARCCGGSDARRDACARGARPGARAPRGVYRLSRQVIAITLSSSSSGRSSSWSVT